MAVNQAQVDHIISTASADDPEVRLLKLQDEVDLLKTSIKRLLIDIRERMNNMDNPFNMSSEGCDQGPQSKVAGARKSAADNKSSGAGSQSSQPGPREAEPEDTVKEDARPLPGGSQAAPPPPEGYDAGRSWAAAPVSGSEFLRAMVSKTGAQPGMETGKEALESPVEGKVRLQKVFRLFAWTSKNVKLYGHDRVDLMLESYRAMGYITSESCSLVKDIARLMPNSLGEQHDIKADEYVRELYELNHILDPGDVSLDRDMIEVFMHQRGSGETLARPGTVTGQGEDIAPFARNKDRI
jgi:hypothetical protein